MSKVIAMQVTSAEKHPNADALRLYQFTAPEIGETQVIANLENIYEVGDVVAVAMEGAVLQDDTEIRPVMLRGVMSHGMALGKVYDEIGTDLSYQYCKEPTEINVQIIKWPSIEHLHHIKRNVGMMYKDNDARPPIVKYKGKTKQDGTCAGVQITPDGQVVAQSHTRLLIGCDNYGFAEWVSKNQDYFRQLKTYKTLVVFGEWSGLSIQKRCSISKLDRKILAVFAIRIGYDYIYEPEEIRKILPPHPDIYVLPWIDNFEVELDFAALPEKLQQQAEPINQMVEAVEKCDPWVKVEFGIEGLGEGVVMYPTNLPNHQFTDFLFKAKGEAHRVVNTKKSAQVTMEAASGLNDFIKLVLTPARLEQGVERACNGEYDVKKMGDFLKWIAGDIQKECQAEMQEAGLTWKAVSKRLSSVARDWYKSKAMEL